MIKGKVDYSQLDIKRFYLPNLVLETTCPHCKSEIKVDLADNYPYQFKEDGSCQISFNCKSCEESVDKNMKLSISIEEV